MKLVKRLAVACIATIALAGCSTVGGSVNQYTKISDGVMVATNGMTLYTFDKDSAGKSACNGPCATNWPPVLVDANATVSGDYSLVTRDDGKKQLAYKGKPLYFWSKDLKPGDKTGDGFLNNAWHVIKM